jgi:hypothetical protein
LLDEIGASWDACDAVASVQLTRRSVKQPTIASSNNGAMNAVSDGALAAEPAVTEIAAALTRWYADHSAIRRVWAIEDSVALKVLIALEPTSDGDDVLPVWLANSGLWRSDLRLRLQREVQLQLVLSASFDESDVNPDAAPIAEVSWRDSWITP